MREFKFRAWDGKGFVQVNKLEYVKASESFTNEDGFSVNNHRGIPCDWLQQYTGLQDKNGKEIYEGDIAKVESSIEKLNGVGFVYWSDDGGYWGVKSGPKKLPWMLSKIESIEVIGNMFENPELL